VEALAESGGYLNGLELRLNAVGPDGSSQEVTLQQTAPGQYAGEFTPLEPGAYVLRVSEGEGDGDGGPETGGEGQDTLGATMGWVYAYSPEYALFEGGAAMLANLASAGGGFSLGADLNPLLAHNLPAERAVRPVWPWLLALAALLLPLDIAVRRLALTKSDWQRLWVKISGLFSLRRVQPEVYSGPQSAPVAALKKVKSRSGFQPDSAMQSPPVRASVGKENLPSQEKPLIPAVKDAPVLESSGEEEVQKAPVGPSTAASLLASKRKREKK